jgi:hypothetical protein
VGGKEEVWEKDHKVYDMNRFLVATQIERERDRGEKSSTLNFEACL